MSIKKTEREFVRERANRRCEYCQRPDRIIGMLFQIDHIKPQALEGSDELENLAYACVDCNSHKSYRETCQDPLTKESVAIFNPRTQTWKAHFEWSTDKTVLLGLSPEGRATVDCLELNTEILQEARKIWQVLGWPLD